MNRQSNNSARDHAFLYIILAITARPGQENAKFHILWRT